MLRFTLRSNYIDFFSNLSGSFFTISFSPGIWVEVSAEQLVFLTSLLGLLAGKSKFVSVKNCLLSSDETSSDGTGAVSDVVGSVS